MLFRLCANPADNIGEGGVIGKRRGHGTHLPARAVLAQTPALTFTKGVQLRQQVPVVTTCQTRRIQGQVTLGPRTVTGRTELAVKLASPFAIPGHSNRRHIAVLIGNPGNQFRPGSFGWQQRNAASHLLRRGAGALTSTPATLKLFQLQQQ